MCVIFGVNTVVPVELLLLVISYVLPQVSDGAAELPWCGAGRTCDDKLMDLHFFFGLYCDIQQMEIELR